MDKLEEKWNGEMELRNGMEKFSNFSHKVFTYLA